MSYKRGFKSALSDASNWQTFITDSETNCTCNEAKDICLKKIYDKHIDNISDEIDSLYDDIRDLEYQNDKLLGEISDLEDTIDSFIKVKTLNDVEKIEFLKENWNNIEYDKLKMTIYGI
jgi:predicted RNase H-like nuclease (RuvC/YqgF family)